MPINALRKHGAKMSLQEALERVEKLKRLMKSSNPHEAAAAEARLKAFDIEAARAPRVETVEEKVSPSATTTPQDKSVVVLDELPDQPYKELGELEVHQSPEKKSVNWDELHFELLERAQNIGADALINLQLKGTIKQKTLCGLALKYLTPQELLDIKEANRLEEEEKAYWAALKERRDEESAPEVG